MKEQSIFLGANGYHGFFSLYDEYIDALQLRRLYVLKGGAGCGKSTFMRRIGELAGAAGDTVITVLCSGDPDSLDGVVLPERGVALFDGTAPHVLEPKLVGQQGFYLDLSRFYTSPAPDLSAWDRGCREHYRKAYLFLSAAGSVEALERLSGEAETAIRRRASALAERNLKRRSGAGKGSVTRFFTDAFTCRGSLSLPETRRALAPRLISLPGGGIRGHLFLETLLTLALDRGYDAVVCPDPLAPERIAHLLLPEAGFGVTTGEGDRRIHLEKLGGFPAEGDKASRRETGQLRRSLLRKARKELSLAKFDHDRLEEAVHPFVDFDAVEEAAGSLARRLLTE